MPHWVLGLACYGVRDWAGMTQAYEDALAVSGRNLIALTMLGAELAERGDLDGARALCAELEARARRDYIPHTAMA